jgi:hypothetical protein
MNALKTLPTPEKSRTTLRNRRQRKSNRDRAVVAETSVKLLVNGVLSIAAIATLVKLLPYSVSIQSKLKEVSLEVAEIEERVDPLRDDFNRNFSPQQTKNLMQEQSPRVDPDRRRIVLLK